MKVQVTRDATNEYPYDQFEGFTKIDELEWCNESYQFEITGVWVRDSDGTVWTADDSGCSCPSPWENTNELERLFSLEPIKARYRTQLEDEYSYGHVNKDEYDAFCATVQAALDSLAVKPFLASQHRS